MALIEFPIESAAHLLHQPAQRVITDDAVHVTLRTRVPCRARLRLVDPSGSPFQPVPLAESTAASVGYRNGMHLVSVSVPRSVDVDPVVRLDLLLDEADVPPGSASGPVDLALALGLVAMIDAPRAGGNRRTGVLPVQFGPIDFGDLGFAVDHGVAFEPLAEAIRTALRSAVAPSTSRSISELIERTAPGATRRRRLETAIDRLTVAEVLEVGLQLRRPQPGGVDAASAIVAARVFRAASEAYTPVAEFAGNTLATLFGLPLAQTPIPAGGRLSATELTIGGLVEVNDLLAKATGQPWGGAGLLGIRGSLDLLGFGHSIALSSGGAAIEVGDDELVRRFERFVTSGRIVAGLAMQPFGLSMFDARVRVVLPNFDAHPSATSWTPPERRRGRGGRWPSRAEVLRAAGPAGRDLLANPNWNGDLGSLDRSMAPGRLSLRGRDLGPDYFPHGGLLAAGRLLAPKLITEAPPFDDIATAVSGPPDRRLAAVGRLLEATRPTEPFGDLAFSIPAPDPPVGGGTAAKQLAGLRTGGRSGQWPQRWALDQTVTTGVLNGSILGVVLRNAPCSVQDGALRVDATKLLPSWLSGGGVKRADLAISPPAGPVGELAVAAIRAEVDGTPLRSVAEASARAVLTGLSDQGITFDDGRTGPHLSDRLLEQLESLPAGGTALDNVAALFAAAVPAVEFSAVMGPPRLPSSVADWLDIGTAEVRVDGRSPFFDGAADEGAAGGLAVRFGNVRIDLGPVARTLRSPTFSLIPPLSSRAAPVLRGRFSLPSFGFRPFSVTSASLDIDTGRRSPLIARLTAEPLELGPMRIEPIDGPSLRLTVDAATGRVEFGPSRLVIRNELVEVVAELRGPTADAPFTFSLNGRWSGTARLTRLVVRNPFRPTGRAMLRLDADRDPLDVLVSGAGGIASLGVAITEAARSKFELFPWMGFNGTGPTDVLVNARGDLTVSVPASPSRAAAGIDLDATLRFGAARGRPFAGLEQATATVEWLPGATFTGDFSIDKDRLQCRSGRLTGSALAALFGAVDDGWELIVSRARRGPTLAIAGRVPGFDLGIFAVRPINGSHLPVGLGPAGAVIGPAEIAAELPGLSVTGILHGPTVSEPVSISATDRWDGRVTITELRIANPMTDGGHTTVAVPAPVTIGAVGISAGSMSMTGLDPIPFSGSLMGQLTAGGSDRLVVGSDGSWTASGERTLDVAGLEVAGSYAAGLRPVGARLDPHFSISGSASVAGLSFTASAAWDGSWWRADGLSLGTGWVGRTGAIDARATGWELQARGGQSPLVRLDAVSGAAIRVFGQTVTTVDSLQLSAEPAGVVLDAGSPSWIELIPDLLQIRCRSVRLDTSNGSLRLDGDLRALRSGSSWRLALPMDWELDADDASFTSSLVSGSGFGSILPTTGLLHRTGSTALTATRHANGLFELQLTDLVFAPLWNSFAIDAGIAPSGAFSAAVDGAQFLSGPFTLEAGAVTVEGNLRSFSLGGRWKMLTGIVTSAITGWPGIPFPATGFTTSRNPTGSGSTTPAGNADWAYLPGTFDTVEYKCTSPKVEVRLRTTEPRLRSTVDLGSISIRPTGPFFGVQGLFTRTWQPPAKSIDATGNVDGLGFEWPSPPRPTWWVGPWPPLLPDLSDASVALEDLLA